MAKQNQQNNDYQAIFCEKKFKLVRVIAVTKY